jgi:hypothetical protein
MAFAQSSVDGIGSICGRVLDEKGTPASNIHVIAMVMSPSGHSGGYPGAPTDASGHYCIEGLQLGEYVLTADDEGLGYPQRGSSFYSWHTPDPRATLTAQVLMAHLDWQVPFRAGFLRLHLPAAHTANDRVPMKFELVVRSRPRLGLMSVTTFPEMEKSKVITELLPPDEDVLLTVTSPDHLRWPDDGSEGRLLHLHSGEMQELAIPSLKANP